MKTLVTHSGNFHADEVFAFVVLERIFGAQEIKLIRTRDPQKISTGDVVFDVGGVYDAESDKFDHHQSNRAGYRKNGVPYASFGLVWKKYGVVFCGSKDTADLIDEQFVQVIDALDNGYPIVETKVEEMLIFTISDLISLLNPRWDEKERDFDKGFWQAVEVARVVLDRVVYHIEGKVKAKSKIEEFVQISPDERVLELDRYYPWEDIIDLYPKILFVLYPAADGKWCIQAIETKKGTFKNRMDLPADWAGKEERELAEITGVEDAKFCHPGRFICGAATKEGAKKLLRLILNDYKG